MKFKFTLVFSLIIITLILLPISPAKTVATEPCEPIAGRVNATGLITTGPGTSGTSGFGTSSGTCIVSNDAVLKTSNIPTYADLKSKYYTQSKAEKSKIDRDGTQSDLSSITADTVYYVTGSFTLSGNPPASKTYVVFVDGQLNINNDFIYGTNTTGIVFIVAGNVNILKTVTRIDAVIISEGIIYTAGPGCATSTVAKLSDGTTAISPLTINGSLISLDSSENIEFCRTLDKAGNDTAPAEIINHQVKYLVILRNIMSDTVQTWTEVLN